MKVMRRDTEISSHLERSSHPSPNSNLDKHVWFEFPLKLDGIVIIGGLGLQLHHEQRVPRKFSDLIVADDDFKGKCQSYFDDALNDFISHIVWLIDLLANNRESFGICTKQ